MLVLQARRLTVVARLLLLFYYKQNNVLNYLRAPIFSRYRVHYSSLAIIKIALMMMMMAVVDGEQGFIINGTSY